MNNHAKASPAGSTEGSGGSRGIVRRDGAIRGRTRRGDGSGAPSTRRAKGVLSLFALALCAIGLTAAPALAAPPTLTVDAPTAVSYTSVHLSGTVDPADQDTSWEFEVSTDGFNWSGFNFVNPPLPANSGPEEVTMDLSGLDDGTTYFVRLSAISDSQYFSAEPNPEFTTSSLPDPTVTIDPASAVTSSSAHFSGTINPNAPGGNPSESDVSWHFECTPECPNLTGGTIAADGSDHTVEADTTGLKPGVEYQVTLYASNAADAVSAGPEIFTTSPVPATISGLSANPLYTEATLRGSIEPGGAETSYHFEYGTTPGYGQSTPTQTVAAGNEPVKISSVIQGLAPGTEYHYRLVTGNAADNTVSEDRTFTTASTALPVDNCPNAAIRAEQESSWLPECRAYELVNPPGLDIVDVTRQPGMTDDGERVAWTSAVGPEDASGVGVHYIGVASRGASGWTNTDANLPVESGESGTPEAKAAAFSADMTKELYRTVLAPDPADTDESADYYLLDVGQRGAGARWVSTELDDLSGNQLHLMGAASDLSRVVYEITPEDGITNRQLSIWVEGEGSKPVTVLPNGELADFAVAAQYSHFPYMDPISGNAFPDAIAAHGGVHSVSIDGRRVFFSARTGLTHRYHPLYLRDTVAETTTLISGSELAGEVGIPKPALFMGASPSGDVAFIATSHPLTEASEVVAANGGVYEVDTVTGAKTFVAPLTGGVWGGIEGITGGIVSDDASHLYFASSEATLPGAVEGQNNIYMWSHGDLELVATAANGTSLQRTSRDGRFMLFSSQSELEGSTNDGHQAIFRYDASIGDVSCVSCRLDGSPSEGDSVLQAFPAATGSFSFPTPTRNVTDDGRVFFSSTDKIVSGDRTSARDVYEYHDGRVSLLTEGRGGKNSYLMDNSDDGRNVFILTRAPVVPQDRDASELDMYDIRVDGGFPNPSVAPGPAPCEGDGCQGQSAAAPQAVAPGSAGVAGAGNVKPRKKHHKKKHHKKKHHGKKKHGKKRQHKGGESKQRDADRNGRTGR